MDLENTVKVAPINYFPAALFESCEFFAMTFEFPGHHITLCRINDILRHCSHMGLMLEKYDLLFFPFISKRADLSEPQKYLSEPPRYHIYADLSEPQDT